MDQANTAAGTVTVAVAVGISGRAAARLREGHLWVYRSDVVKGEAESGALVTVAEPGGRVLGSGLWSGQSQIAIRMVAGTGGLDRAGYLASAGERLQSALRLRESLAPVSDRDSGQRLVFSEADGLPGIVVDRYGELAVVQLLIPGTAQADMRALLGQMLGSLPGIATVVERTDPRVRQLEGMQVAPGEPLYVAAGLAEPVSRTEFRLNGVRLGYDVNAGQKTGAFLDQRLNYRAAAKYGRGRALDVCAYQGGFALSVAAGSAAGGQCARVTGVDASRTALEAADRNLERNPEITAEVDWVEADAFELLRAWESTERFGTIVLDPPAFAKTKRAVDGALRGYKELNLRAMRMLEPGGTLVTCSCSHHVGTPEFLEAVRAAAVDAGKRVQVLEIRGAAPDHPAVLTLPETSYLKCVMCRVD